MNEETPDRKNFEQDHPPEVQESWELLKEVVDRGDRQALSEVLETLSSGETARAISRLEPELQNKLLVLLDPEEAADLIEDLPEAQARDLIEDLPEPTAAMIVEELPSDSQADILGALDEEDAEAILNQMDPAEATETRRLLSFPPNTAGGLMVTEFLSYGERQLVSEIIHDLRKNAEIYRTYDVLYAYIVSDHDRLLGVVNLRDILLSPPAQPVHDWMKQDIVSVSVHASLDSLEEVFDRYGFFGIPVTDERGSLVGIVQRSALADALEQQAGNAFLSASGILGGDELRSLSITKSIFRRFSVLGVKIGLNLISASVISVFSSTIEQAVALALFLPIISDLVGSAGNQAVAVSIRELSLGILKPKDYALVIYHELKVGMRVGAMLGLLLGLVAWFWKGSYLLGIVVGLAEAIATTLAVMLGGILPLFFKRLKIDPAAFSSAILTTITDAAGFFFLLAFASIALHYFHVL